VRDYLSSALLAGVLFISATAVQADDHSSDPWEGFNRSIFEFNEGVDKYALKPITLGYKAITPDPVETGVHNFFENLSDVGSIFNGLLQGKLDSAVQDLARVSFNTTLGLGGFIDVSTPMGIDKHDEDFGQTLAVWGVSSGPYVVLPLFGPSTVRDTAGLVVDTISSPINNIEPDSTRYAVSALQVVDTRAQLLDAESLITGDRYIFIRDAYLQRREFSINDGQVEDYDDDNF